MITIDRTPRTVETANTSIVITDEGITVTADEALPADADDNAWELLCDEAFAAIGGVEAVEAAIYLKGNLTTASDGERLTEFFPWRMTLEAFASKVADVLDTVTVTSSDDGHELTEYADCYLALTGRVEGVSASESMARFDGDEDVPPRTVRLLNQVFESAGEASRELQRQLWERASQGTWPVE